MPFKRWVPDSHWDNHPEFPPEDWVYEVRNGDTRQGYVGWVNSQLEARALEEQGGHGEQARGDSR